jgi:hypothetical protein
MGRKITRVAKLQMRLLRVAKVDCVISFIALNWECEAKTYVSAATTAEGKISLTSPSIRNETHCS